MNWQGSRREIRRRLLSVVNKVYELLLAIERNGMARITGTSVTPTGHYFVIPYVQRN